MNNEEMAIQIQKGNGDLIEQLYLKNLNYIRKIVKRYSNENNYEDLMQESYFGIVEAIKNWNPDVGFKFLTYATSYIKAVIFNYIRKNDCDIYIPSSMQEKEWTYNSFVYAFNLEHGRDPTTEETTSYMGLSVSQLEEVRRAVSISRKSRSIYDRVIEQAEDSEDLRIIDAIMDPDNPIDDFVDEEERKELSHTLWNIVNSLPERESDIIKYRYKKGKSLKEYGIDSGISGERARQIEQRALRRIRTEYRKELQPYIDDYIYSQGLKQTGLNTFRNTFESSVERTVIRVDEKLQRCSIY